MNNAEGAVPPVGDEGVQAVLGLLFSALDQAEFAPATLLKNFGHKQRYESLLMFARRRLAAAVYHRQRIDVVLAENAEKMSAQAAAGEKSLQAKTGPSLLTPTSASVKSYTIHEEAIYELGALLGALRSGADFLATVGIMHLKGREGDSVGRMLAWRSQELTAPSLDAIVPHEDWLLELRAYRDHLVHKQAITASSGFSVSIEGSSVATSVVPPTVPSTTPSYLPDTRYARMVFADERPFGIMEQSSQAWMTNADGSKTILQHEHSFKPAPGYELITALADRHLAAFRAFFAQYCNALIQTGFQAEVAVKQTS